MAAVIDARPRANEPAANAGRAQAFEIRKIEIADVLDCIAEGVRDFGRAPLYGMFFGAIYAVGGVMMVWFAFATDCPYLAGRDLWLALTSLFTFIVWLYLALFVFLSFYGANTPSLSQVFADIFTTPSGLAFLLTGNGLGAIIALAVFSIAAFSPPLVVDHDVDFVTAMTANVRAVMANPRPMLAGRS